MNYGKAYSVIFDECRWIGNAVELIELLKEAAEIAGATFLDCCQKEFEPQGSSGVILLSESHYAVHTWPERNSVRATFDTCGDVDSLKAVIYVGEKLGAQSIWISVTNFDTRTTEVFTLNPQGGNMLPLPFT